MKRKILCIMLILAMLSVMAYAASAKIKWVSEDRGVVVTVRIFEDVETGINYFVVTTPNCVSVTPRLNADGTLYVTEGR